MTFREEADVEGSATGSSDRSQGAIPKNRDAIRAARVTGEKAGSPSAESEERLRGKLARCVIRVVNIREGEPEVEP